MAQKMPKCKSIKPSAPPTMATLAIVLLSVALALAGCGAFDEPATPQPVVHIGGAAIDGTGVEFVADVWADNWFAIYINGELAGEDSTPITTERSFNAETIRFVAEYPLTIGIEAKDFKETDSGIEYIGEGNQQMGDGGIIAQITSVGTGQVVAATNRGWQVRIIHRAPLNTDCENDPDPDATCQFEIAEAPVGWAGAGFDAGNWNAATEWTEDEVRPKDGYDNIEWDDAARLVWGSDLKVDNTILLRRVVPAP